MITPDLLLTTPRQRRVALARPWFGVAAFATAVWLEWWWLTPFIMFGIFVAVVTVTHDVVHRAIGLSERQTDWALFFCGLVLLESGHAYRITHLQHHKVFPGKDDPEGYPAHITFPQAVLYGPVFLYRLWWWAWKRVPRARAWLAVEAAMPFLALIAGIVWSRGLLAYAVLAIVGSWVYPLLTVYLPHHDFGDTPMTQTRTLRGRVIPAMFLELTYHLEHHLHPQVPSHRLAELSKRLDPVLEAAGIKPRRVI